MTIPITPMALNAAGFYFLRCGSDGFDEYWRSLDPDQDDGNKYWKMWTLEVRFDHNSGYPDSRSWMVYIAAPHNSIAVRQAVTIEDLDELYRLFHLPHRNDRDEDEKDGFEA